MSSPTMFSRLLLGTTLAFALVLTGCGGGGGSAGSSLHSPLPSGGSTSSGTDCAQPKTSDLDGCTYVSLSDDTGDFLTYRVDVTKLVLVRRDGSAVSIIPSATTVDFAQYTSLAEYLSLNAVPAGDYVSGVITLNFTGADIEAQDSSGNPVALQPVDTSGKPLGSVDVTIVMDSTHPLSLFPGKAHVLGINFDLNASNVVNTGSSTVTVQPFLVASADVAAANTEQVRGPLGSITGNTFTLGLQPFQASSGDFGDVPVGITTSTAFVINQQVSFGGAGVVALNAAGKNTPVVARGSFDFTSGQFIASEVLAGSSVPGASEDAVEGVVAARNGNTLSVIGGNLYRNSGGTISFNDRVTVNVGTGTTVQESDILGTPETIANISVGQHILAFGSFGGASSTTLDATQGFALLRFSSVDGSVLSLVNNGDNSSINLNVDEIENRPVAMFDFTGTNSDHTNYFVHLPCSCLNTGVGVGDPVTVSGFVSAFGTAPPDFNAQALTDFSLADSVMSVVWATPTANAFTSIDANSGVVANLASSPTVHTLREGGQVSDLNSLGGTPAAVSKSLGSYAISQGGQIQLYLNFSDFVTALNADLAAGSKVSGFFAVGAYDGPDKLITATSIAVILK